MPRAPRPRSGKRQLRTTLTAIAKKQEQVRQRIRSTKATLAALTLELSALTVEYAALQDQERQTQGDSNDPE